MRFMELQLIQLYLWVCLVYDKHPMLKYQRLSNNWQPTFTDQELITIYLFGHIPAEFQTKKDLRLYFPTLFRLVRLICHRIKPLIIGSMNSANL